MRIYKMFPDKSWLVKGWAVVVIEPQKQDRKREEGEKKKEKRKRRGIKTIVCESLKNFSLAICLLPIESAIWDYVETSFFW